VNVVNVYFGMGIFQNIEKYGMNKATTEY